MKIGLAFPRNRRNTARTPGPHHGVAVYVQELVRNLVEVDQGAHEYYLIGCQPSCFPEVEHERIHKVAFTWNVLSGVALHSGLWEEWAGRKFRLDLIHQAAPGSPPWRWSSRPLLLTVHDLTPILLPETFPVRFRIGFRLGFWFNARQAAHIVCMSDNTRSDLDRLFPGIGRRSAVIPLAPQRLTCAVDNAGMLEAYGIKKPYVLSVSTIEPRKNHVALFDAVAVLQARGCNHQLVCVGGMGWKTREILSCPALRSHRERIIFTGAVDVGTLGQLYRHADCFVYPTLYEGFGLPPLEALACGIPAIVSRNSSLPEVLGDAPYWLSAHPSGLEIASAVIQLAARPELRRERIERGYAQAKRYDWKRTALDTLSLYERVAKKG